MFELSFSIDQISTFPDNDLNVEKVNEIWREKRNQNQMNEWTLIECLILNEKKKEKDSFQIETTKQSNEITQSNTHTQTINEWIWNAWKRFGNQVWFWLINFQKNEKKKNLKCL